MILVDISLTSNVGDQLYVGCTNGNLQIYRYTTNVDDVIPQLELVKTQSLGRKPIDQLGILPQTNQLVALSGKSLIYKVRP
jgi:hypothetical protein